MGEKNPRFHLALATALIIGRSFPTHRTGRSDPALKRFSLTFPSRRWCLAHKGIVANLNPPPPPSPLPPPLCFPRAARETEKKKKKKTTPVKVMPMLWTPVTGNCTIVAGLQTQRCSLLASPSTTGTAILKGPAFSKHVLSHR